jgi:hypothetical protein
MADPTGAKPRVDTDANEGFAATRAKNLAQTVLEYKERTQFGGQAVQAADPVDALYFPASHAVHVLDVDPLLQEATKPEETTVLSDVNTTCMYPVLDVWTVPRPWLPDSFATCSKHEEDEVQRFMVTKSYPSSVVNDENERLIKPLEAMSH